MKYLVTGFILDADKKLYSKLVEDLENSYSASINEWLKDLQSAYIRLVKYRFDIKNYLGGL